MANPEQAKRTRIMIMVVVVLYSVVIIVFAATANENANVKGQCRECQPRQVLGNFIFGGRRHSCSAEHGYRSPLP